MKKVILSFALLLSGISSASALVLSGAESSGGVRPQKQFAAPVSSSFYTRGLPSFADLIETLQPTVVNISTTLNTIGVNEENNDNWGIISSNPTIQEYFAPRQNQHQSLGSGFIVDERGYIITNYHVIDKAKEINVILADNRHYQAQIVGKDIKTDLALLKINASKPLPAVKLGDSDKIRVGDWVIAIGNPFGLGGSVSVGIVSAKSRDIDAGSYDNFIQTDASINMGSSGGPMFDDKGRVIGINSAIYSTNGGNMGIGFAVPINLAKFVISELKNKGKVERGWLGIKIQDNYSNNGDKPTKGIVVSSVASPSPAQLAGLKAGDIIVKLNGKPITSPKEFSRLIAETKKGTKLKLEIIRENKIVKLQPTVELLQDSQHLPQASKAPKLLIKDNSEKEVAIGLKFANLNKDLRLKYDIAENIGGVIISEVSAGSDAEVKGLKVGDIVNEVDNNIVVDINDIRAYIEDAKLDNNRPMRLLINKHSDKHVVTVKL